MKKNITFPAAFLLLSMVFSCSSTGRGTNYTNGTVKFISLEGGFYGIIADDNKNYHPLNLSKEFQTDGMRIRFKYIERKDMASIHMWGIIVEIKEINELK